MWDQQWFGCPSTWIWFVISPWKIGMNWGVCKHLDTCNGTWVFCSPMETCHGFCSTMETCNGNCQWKPKLSTTTWLFSKDHGNFWENHISTGIIDGLILMGNSWCAQWKIMGVYIVMSVNNILNIRPAVVCIPFKCTFPIWCVISTWKVGMNWGLCKLLDTCNSTWGFCGPMETHVMGLGIEKLVILWKHIMGLGIEKLSAAKWSFLSYYGNM